MCLLAEVDIDYILLLLQTFKVVQIHPLLIQTNTFQLHSSSESSCLSAACSMSFYSCYCTLLLRGRGRLKSRHPFLELRATNTFSEEVHQHLCGGWEWGDTQRNKIVGWLRSWQWPSFVGALDCCYQPHQCKPASINKVNTFLKISAIKRWSNQPLVLISVFECLAGFRI